MVHLLMALRKHQGTLIMPMLTTQGPLPHCYIELCHSAAYQLTSTVFTTTNRLFPANWSNSTRHFYLITSNFIQLLNTLCTLKHLRTSHQSTFRTSPLPPVPPRILKKIISGVYIDFTTLTSNQCLLQQRMH